MLCFHTCHYITVVRRAWFSAIFELTSDCAGQQISRSFRLPLGCQNPEINILITNVSRSIYHILKCLTGFDVDIFDASYNQIGLMIRLCINIFFLCSCWEFLLKSENSAVSIYGQVLSFYFWCISFARNPASRVVPRYLALFS